MIDLQIHAENTTAADALWRLLISQEHGADDRPEIGSATVRINGREAVNFLYTPEHESWTIQY